MGLYDDRLADLSESRQRRAAGRRPLSSRNPFLRTRRAPRKKSTTVQSLLFSRSEGWTTSKAKSWAKANGYKYGKVDVTDQYIRIRQLDPKGFKTKRTIPFGRGIRAVVAREGSGEKSTMARATEARRRRRRSKKSAPAPKRRRRRRKVQAVQARRRRRKVRVEAKRSRRRRRVAAAPVVQVRRRRRRRRVKAWRGNSGGHATAARKGWRRRKKSGTTHRRRRRRVRTSTVAEAPRRRRRRRVAAAPVVQARRRRHRRHHMMASRGGGMSAGEMVLALVSGGVGFVAADGLDRFLATYNPSGTERPKDKFTSDGAGTLANTLNIASRPGLIRAGAATGMVAVPAIGAMFAKRSPMVRSSLEGFALGAGISAFKSLWNNVVMPLLIGKDTSTPAMQKSFIARLYPAEVSAHVNMAAQKAGGNAAGMLSGQKDVGPFALSGDSPYPNADQALRAAAGVGGDSPYPTAADALRRAGVGGDSPYPDAAQALRIAAGLGWQPGPPPGSGPGPVANPHADSASCGCIGEGDQYASFLGDPAPAE